MSFNQHEYDQILNDIEKYLGYLRANENAWKYIQKVRASMRGGPGTVLTVEPFDADYKFPCPEERFRVKPWGNLDLYVSPPFNAREFVKEVQTSVDASWKNGVAWSAGIADYARSASNQFTQPDVGKLTTAINTMQTQVVEKLAIGVLDDWANLGELNARWTGASADEFNNFYLNFNEALNMFAIFGAYVNTGFAYSAGVISGTQVGAMTFVRDIRDNLVGQLDQWVKWGRQPSDPPETPPWVADIAKYASDIYTIVQGVVPVLDKGVEGAKKLVSTVKGKVDDVKGRIEAAERVSGKEILPKSDKHLPVKTAEEVYESLTKTLHDDYLKKYQEALDKVNDGTMQSGPPKPGETATENFSGARVLELRNSVKNWYLPDVPAGSMKAPGDRY